MNMLTYRYKGQVVKNILFDRHESLIIEFESGKTLTCKEYSQSGEMEIQEFDPHCPECDSANSHKLGCKLKRDFP